MFAKFHYQLRLYLASHGKSPLSCLPKWTLQACQARRKGSIGRLCETRACANVQVDGAFLGDSTQDGSVKEIKGRLFGARGINTKHPKELFKGHPVFLGYSLKAALLAEQLIEGLRINLVGFANLLDGATADTHQQNLGTERKTHGLIGDDKAGDKRMGVFAGSAIDPADGDLACLA